MVLRHNKLWDVFLDFCQCACQGPCLEMGCGAGYTNSQSRPADVLVPNWDRGKPAAFDLSVTSTLHPSVLLEASMTARSAALVAENRKHKYNDRKCEELGWVCIPLVVEPQPRGGTTCNHEEAYTDEMKSIRVRSAMPLELYSALNWQFSIRCDRLC